MHPIYLYIKQSLSDIYPATEAAAIAKSILLDTFHFSQTELYIGKDTEFAAEDYGRLQDILLRLRQQEPLQYITGEAVFCGLTLRVNPSVLIPRPETAELVDWIVSDYQADAPLRILDIGTGSGCIPISLAKVLPGAQISAWDISDDALLTAEENAKANGVSVAFRKVDVLGHDYPQSELDILVSNPPYIAEKERKDMDANVLNWEPGIALFVPDEDPLIFYRRIADIGLALLKTGGSLYFEINQAYGQETVDLLREKDYRNVMLRKDLSGNDRMIKASRP